MEHMKWWGWGDEGINFSHDDKPGFAPLLREEIGLDVDNPAIGISDFDALSIAEPNIAPSLRSALVTAVGAGHVKDEALERVVHTYGKSLRDLLRIRANDLGRLPDVIVYPANEEQVAGVLKACLAADAVVIPFGGGTNISGSLEAPRGETRTVISLDMGRMNRLIEIDDASRIARIEAGALGPHIEEQLNARGWTLGHFPDSFKHSTLGGWIATRSSGMQSDKYGDIADLTRAVRVVTPTGVLATRPVPSTSTGPSVREMVLGSEGRLGIITEATVHVHKLPEERIILAYLLPDWPRALQALRDIAASDATPSATRVSDANETRFSFATKKRGSAIDELKSNALKIYLKKRLDFDVSRMCLSFIGFEGSSEHIKANRKLVGSIVSKHGGLCVGTGPGEIYDQKKFDTPYIRDYLLDRGGLADVAETSTAWSRLNPLYEAVVESANKAFAEIGVAGWIMCHLSHSYHAGACLYFTFAFKSSEGANALAQYDVVKTALQQAFVDNGGTLSHHHAVGVEHAQWLEQDISAEGVHMVKVLFDGIDPGHNLNPGKIVD